MKVKSFLVVIAVALLAVGCNSKKSEMLENEVMKLRAANDSLALLKDEGDSSILTYVNSFNDIQNNLDSIKRIEKIISVSSNGEKGKSSEQQINEDIKSIYRLLQKNKQLVANLRAKLNSSDKKIVELETMIENLNKMLVEKDAEIQNLRGQLAKLNIRVEEMSVVVNDLSVSNQEKSQTIAEQTAELNTGYYVIGTKAELRDAGIIKSNVLTKDLPKNKFIKIDITKVKSIPVGGKKVVIISNHPTSSYKIIEKDKMVESIEILNPQDFWSISKYLVIQMR